MLIPFSKDNLFSSLSSPSCTVEEIKQHNTVLYLYRYLEDLRLQVQDGIISILVEENYIDSDFMDDFSFYYVRCFRPYSRHCKRLHFFLLPPDSEPLLALSKGEVKIEDKNLISESYLGFVVARPLPYAVIGRTIIKTYGPDGGRRKYTAVRDYEVNVMGLTLTVKNTLAFQEQDSVVAACASVALWAAFQKSSELYKNSLSPTTTAITSVATIIPSQTRPFPSKGLIIEQMVNAVKHVGLEPEIVKFSGNLPLASLMYSYLAMGQPIILIVDVHGLGRHAVTVSGYSMLEKPHRPSEIGNAPEMVSIPMKGLNINEFYAHDDQHGAFCALKIEGAGDDLYFTGEWEQDGSRLALDIYCLIIPIHNKIRVTFDDIYQWICLLTPLIFLGGELNSQQNPYQWDIRLSTSNSFKTEILESSGYEDSQKKVLLSQV